MTEQFTDTQQTLNKAMLNNQLISFQYSRIGRNRDEEIKNARVIFISNKLGKKIVATDVAHTTNGAAGWKHFDLSSMCNVQIL